MTQMGTNEALRKGVLIMQTHWDLWGYHLLLSPPDSRPFALFAGQYFPLHPTNPS
jgi:hypothetical protein